MGSGFQMPLKNPDPLFCDFVTAAFKDKDFG